MSNFTLTLKTLAATLLASILLALAVYGAHVISLKIIYFFVTPQF